MADPRPDPGLPRLAAGRSAVVYDLGDGRVLRRRNDGPVPEHEVVGMRHAAAAAYPVPRVHAVDGPDLVLDRIDGTDMLTLLGRRPWLAIGFARTLADLHVRLREIAPPDDLRADGPPVSLVHGDLHPGNVLVTADGPVVIDWENACGGPADFDVATTWLLMFVSEPDDVPAAIRPFVGLVKATMRSTFLRRVGRPSRETVDRVCARRLADPNFRPVEIERVRRFRERHGAGGVAPVSP